MSIIDLDLVEDHERHRAELASIQPDGRRRWIYARAPRGRYTTYRRILSVFLVAFLVLAPFVTVGGHQFILLNVITREFVLFGVPFWPNDFYLVALLFLTGVVTVVLFTATLGRIWCGWLCPQTVFMEMIFRNIEWMIEGGPQEQALRRRGSWTWDRLWRASIKVALFASISFGIANVFLAYVVSRDQVVMYIVDGPTAHVELFGGLLFFTFVFFMVFYRFREQACLIACPYGRYMSALVDENTVAVTYDYTRGESRMKWSKADNHARTHSDTERFSRPHGAGDCVDCHQCVTVCPTGIDIRNGIQLECVNCTACIDACDEVMDKVGIDRGLIRYSSLNAVEQGTSRIFTRRIKAYLAVWVVFVTVVGVLFAKRSDLDVVLLRQPKSTWTTMVQGTANFYSLNIINKTSQDLPFAIAVVSPSGYTITPLNLPTEVKAEQKMEGRLIIIRSSLAQRAGDETVRLEVRSRGVLLRTIETTFIGPQE